MGGDATPKSRKSSQKSQKKAKYRYSRVLKSTLSLVVKKVKIVMCMYMYVKKAVDQKVIG